MNSSTVGLSSGVDLASKETRLPLRIALQSRLVGNYSKKIARVFFVVFVVLDRCTAPRSSRELPIEGGHAGVPPDRRSGGASHRNLKKISR